MMKTINFSNAGQNAQQLVNAFACGTCRKVDVDPSLFGGKEFCSEQHKPITNPRGFLPGCQLATNVQQRLSEARISQSYGLLVLKV